METRCDVAARKVNAMGDLEMRRLYLLFEGQVQGVGFRWTARRLATQLGLSGWVRNEPDGTVSMELQGTNEQIATFFGKFPNEWGYFKPRFVIAEKEEIALVPGDREFRVRF